MLLEVLLMSTSLVPMTFMLLELLLLNLTQMFIMLVNVKLKLIQKLLLKLMQMLMPNFLILLLLMLDIQWHNQDQLRTISIPHNVKLIKRGNARKFLYRTLAKWLCHTVYLSLCVYLSPAHTAPQ